MTILWSFVAFDGPTDDSDPLFGAGAEGLTVWCEPEELKTNRVEGVEYK